MHGSHLELHWHGTELEDLGQVTRILFDEVTADLYRAPGEHRLLHDGCRNHFSIEHDRHLTRRARLVAVVTLRRQGIPRVFAFGSTAQTDDDRPLPTRDVGLCIVVEDVSCRLGRADEVDDACGITQFDRCRLIGGIGCRLGCDRRRRCVLHGRATLQHGTKQHLALSTDDFERPVLVFDTGEVDHHGVARPDDLRFCHTERIDAGPDDFNRHLQGSRLVLSHRGQGDRGPTLQIETECRSVPDHDVRRQPAKDEDDDAKERGDESLGHGVADYFLSSVAA